MLWWRLFPVVSNWLEVIVPGTVCGRGPPATRGSSGRLGSSSDASGLSSVHIVHGVTRFSCVRSCSGYSGNGLSSHSSKSDVVAFSPHSSKAYEEKLSCSSPCLPGVARLYFTVPWNQTHCLGCPFNEQTYTSAPSGYSGCIAPRSSSDKNDHVWGFGWGSGGGGATLRAGLGLLALQAVARALSGLGSGLGGTGSGAGREARLGAL